MVKGVFGTKGCRTSRLITLFAMRNQDRASLRRLLWGPPICHHLGLSRHVGPRLEEPSKDEESWSLSLPEEHEVV